MPTLPLAVKKSLNEKGAYKPRQQQRQAGIWVLQAVAAPSILVVLGFMLNPSVEYINSE